MVNQNWFANFTSLHFAKVLIARRATTFGKVDYLENQSLSEYVM